MLVLALVARCQQHLCNVHTIFNGKIINDLLLALKGTD